MTHHTWPADTLAAIMSVLVLGIGALVLFYCADYFHHHDGHTENRLPSFAAELTDEQFENFLATADGTIRFADALRAAREGATERPRLRAL